MITPTHPPTSTRRSGCSAARPSNVSIPAVLEAMQQPMLGHLDPDFARHPAEVVALLRDVYRAADGRSCSPCRRPAPRRWRPASPTCSSRGRRSSSGAGLLRRAPRRDRAPPRSRGGQGGGALGARCRTTACSRRSTTTPRRACSLSFTPRPRPASQQPLAELGGAAGGPRRCSMADCVTSLGGRSNRPAEWGVDYAYSCTQKCLGAPPGMCAGRRCRSARLQRIAPARDPVPCLRLRAACATTGSTRPPVYHHTAPVLERLRAARGAAASARGASRPAAPATPTRALPPGRAPRARARAAGRPGRPAAPADRGCVPEERRRARGPAAPAARARNRDRRRPRLGTPIWRIGLMGENATMLGRRARARGARQVLDEPCCPVARRGR